MSMHMIREAGPSDVPGIQRLFDELDSYHVRLLPRFFRDVQRARPDSRVEATISGAESDCFVALLDGRIVGFLEIRESCTPDYPMFIPSRFAFIDNMIVEEAHRGSGIGTLLLEAAKSWARSRELPSIQLMVWSANEEAIRLYEHQGYKRIVQRMELSI